MNDLERRQATRIKTGVRVEVVTQSGQVLAGSCLDLSVSGAQLAVGAELTSGAELLVIFGQQLPAVECAAKVMRTEPAPVNARWRLGVQFQGVSDSTFGKLNNFVLTQLKTRL